MKIDLQPPYSEDWRMGYLVTNPEGRRTVILYNSKESRSSTQYARYLCAVKLGRYLSESETVDHIDGDKTNDSIENLQVIICSWESLVNPLLLERRERWCESNRADQL